MDHNSSHPISDLRLRRAARTVLVTQAFNVAGTLLSLVAVPLYLKWLGRDGYGLLLTGLAFSGYLGFADMGLSWASVVLIAQASGKDDERGIGAIVRNSISLAFISVTIVAAVAGAFVFALKMGIHVPFMPTDKDFPLLLAVVAAAVCQSLMSSPFYGIYHGLQHGYTAGFFQGIGRLTGTCASLAAAWYGASVGMVFLANVAMMTSFNALAAAGAYYFYPWAFVAGPMWERHHISTQLRTGLKNLGLQIGDVVVSSAPVLAISSRIGAAAVPQFTVPLTMLNVPLSFFFSINAALQSGYGEAFGRGDSAWVVRTIRIVLENALILIALVSTGYFLVGSDFVELWTQARLSVTTMQLSSAWLMAVTMSLLGIYRFALVGLNRHRTAAVSEISFALLALAFTVFLVGRWGVVGAGVGVLGAALVTSAWVLPTQLRKVFPGAQVFPERAFFVRLLGVTCCSFATGVTIKLLLHGMLPQIVLVAQVLVTTAVFVLTASMLLQESYARIRRLLLGGISHRFRTLFRRSAETS